MEERPSGVRAHCTSRINKRGNAEVRVLIVEELTGVGQLGLVVIRWERAKLKRVRH